MRGGPSKSLIFIEFEPPGALGEEGWGGGPPKIIDFHSKLAALGARFWGPFWNPFRFRMPSRVALDGKLTILGGLVAEYFFEEILSPFWRVSGQ